MRFFIITAIAILSAFIVDASLFKSKSVRPQPSDYLFQLSQALAPLTTETPDQIRSRLKDIVQLKSQLHASADNASSISGVIDLLDGQIKEFTKAYHEAEAVAKAQAANPAWTPAKSVAKSGSKYFSGHRVVTETQARRALAEAGYTVVPDEAFGDDEVNLKDSQSLEALLASLD